MLLRSPLAWDGAFATASSRLGGQIIFALPSRLVNPTFYVFRMFWLGSKAKGQLLEEGSLLVLFLLGAIQIAGQGCSAVLTPYTRRFRETSVALSRPPGVQEPTGRSVFQLPA